MRISISKEFPGTILRIMMLVVLGLYFTGFVAEYYVPSWFTQTQLFSMDRAGHFLVWSKKLYVTGAVLFL